MRRLGRARPPNPIDDGLAGFERDIPKLLKQVRKNADGEKRWADAGRQFRADVGDLRKRIEKTVTPAPRKKAKAKKVAKKTARKKVAKKAARKETARRK